MSTDKTQKQKYMKEYHLTHKKHRNEISKKFYESHKEKHHRQSAEWAKSHPENERRRHKQYYEAHKERVHQNGRKHRLKKCYGITLDEYNELLNNQNSKCLICGIHIDEHGRDFAVDHDHKTKKVRGLLCTNCNCGLGNFHDDSILLEKAIQYLGGEH